MEGKGDGWRKLSWDEALDEIAEKLTEIKEKYRPESIATHRGTGPRQSVPSTALLALALGTPNLISTDNHICYAPSFLAECWTYGDSITMEIGPDYLNSNCIIVWGGNNRVKLKAKVTPDIHPKVVHAEHAWWFPEKPGPEHGLFESNINVVTSSGHPRDLLACSVPTRGTLCKIYKAKPTVP